MILSYLKEWWIASTLLVRSGACGSSRLWFFLRAWPSSGDTIPNRLGEFRETRKSNERIGIAAYGHSGGKPGATGVERRQPG